MLFSEALAQLKASVPVYRKGWESQDGYLSLMPGMTHVWKIVLQPAPNAGNYIFSVEDLEKDDWELYNEHKAVVELAIEEEKSVESA
jgi:hypothetical protein